MIYQKHLNRLFLTGILVFVIASCRQSPRYPDGLSPEESMKTFQLKEGFAIEPFATEPYVQSPVDMAFDENGGVYVIEMADYPFQADSVNPKGLIKFLKDTDGDGKIDTAFVFADKLASATSVLPWKGGILVTAAPEIVYLKDTTGDYKADIKEVLFTGFFDRNSEAQITSLRFGVDNWIYGNNHGQAGQVQRGNEPQAEPLNVSGADFRFRLDNNQFETESGGGQFGLAIDDWGNRFFTQNTLYIQQAPIAGRYLRRHAFLPSARGSVKIYEDDVMFQKTPPPYWRAERSRRRQHQYDSLGLNRTEWAEGHFTGASGGTFYGGDAFPDDYYGSIFTGEVAGNLIHRTVLKSRKGKAEFEATRAPDETDREFLAATDSWFRPVTLSTGPDGYLYVVDMYLQHIETPVSIPDDLKADMDFEAGKDKGRIYRIFPAAGSKRDLKDIRLGEKSTGELVPYLAHPNQWWRLNAQRLLLERQDRSVIPALRLLVETHSDPRARLHAFYALDGLGAMDARLAKAALKDPHPGVRIHGAIVSERYPQNLPDLIALATDDDDRVTLQAALSLGQFEGAGVREALAGILEKYAGEALFRTAVISSAAGSSLSFINFLSTRSTFFSNEGPAAQFLEEAGNVMGARNHPRELTTLSNNLDTYPEPFRKSLLRGLKKGLKRASPESKQPPALLRAMEETD